MKRVKLTTLTHEDLDTIHLWFSHQVDFPICYTNALVDWCEDNFTDQFYCEGTTWYEDGNRMGTSYFLMKNADDAMLLTLTHKGNPDPKYFK